MKFIFPLILALAFFLFVAPVMAEQKSETQQMKFDKNLLKPDPKFFPSKKAIQSARSKEILDEGNWESFYLSFHSFSRKLNDIFLQGKDRQPSSGEDLNERIWHSYLIAGAPLYKTDLNSPEPWLYRDDDDIRSKANAAAFISALNPEIISKTFSIPQEQLKQLNCTYFAAIIKTLRASYFPDLEERTLKIKEDIFKEHQKDQDTEKWQNSLNILRCMQRRSTLIKFYLDTSLEEGFLRMLIRYFPGKKGEVVKYIRIAGYKNDEINGLIDRSVGRDGTTEFLYKGRSKKAAR